MSGYIIYHPKRTTTTHQSITIYHDPIRNSNQDPYIWNRCFLHTYCHITQMSPKVGDYIFWVNGDTFPNFTHLYCDLVFVVEEKLYWLEANNISPTDPIVDSTEAYQEHYQWAKYQHQLKKRKRFTLKAVSDASFQPQNGAGKLIDLIPLLKEVGWSVEEVQHGLKAGWQSKPMRLDSRAESLYKRVSDVALVKLYGADLQSIKRQLALHVSL